MLTPVVCFTCGAPIGDRELLFLAMRAARVRAAVGERASAPTAWPVLRDAKIDLSDIFERLKVPSMCCRMNLATAVLFEDSF